jgi:hypothetical protein
VRPEEKPVFTKPDVGHADSVATHPAFAQIGASRISGQTRLYGSDFVHQNFVRVRIGKSVLQRSLANDNPYGGSKPYVEVDLSEAQWASFVSSMNVGFGVQCTLRYKDGEEIPAIAAPEEDRQQQFKREAAERAERALGFMDELDAAIDDLKLSEKQKKELRGRVRMARMQLTDNIPFVLGQFGEHIEQTVEKAKVEVNAYVLSTIQRAGLQALGVESGSSPLLGFGESSHEPE